jgi:hypothetical protein
LRGGLLSSSPILSFLPFGPEMALPGALSAGCRWWSGEEEEEEENVLD